jgi:hypothetical protein
MIFALAFLTCLNAIMFFYILDQRQLLKDYEDEINELNKYLHDEIN